jgi:aspartyl protease family protein
LERPPRPSGPHRPALRLLLIAGGVAGIVALAASASSGALDSWDVARGLPMGIILLLMVARLSASTRPLGPMARQLAVFLAFGTVLVVGYSYKDDLNGVFGRALGTIVPSRGVQVAPGMMRFTADESGQFAIDATVNGVAVHFLMDTGASGIALSRRDASRLGFDPKILGYSGMFSTANGMTRAAPVTLDSIEIGPLSADNVPAWVNEGDLDQSLLGMSYLSTLGRIEIRGDTLILER